MPHYYFDIQDGHRIIDPTGVTFKNDHDAIERAKAVAIVVSIDRPEVDPTRYISVLNEAKFEIFTVPIYSKPTVMEAGAASTRPATRVLRRSQEIS